MAEGSAHRPALPVAILVGRAYANDLHVVVPTHSGREVKKALQFTSASYKG